jgi:hypothetical protein
VLWIVAAGLTSGRSAQTAAPAGGVSDIKFPITYLWEEDGVEKNDVHIARSSNDTYRITCASGPTMKPSTLQWAE